MERDELLCVSSLVQDYLQYVDQEAPAEAAPSRAAEVLRKVASSLHGEIEEKLRPFLDSIKIDSVADACSIFTRVMEEEFADGNINWGRILTIFVFGGILAKKLREHGLSLTRENREQISHVITDYIIKTKAVWIKDNGGWDDGFVAKFDDEKPWLSLHNVKTKIMAAFLYFSQYL
ncbi:bcl-2-related protein A1 [Tiliqua scincoides]|uniref:bcl-2-related protein A1 n=1 Tax=Tiliqua scincoides TaxID=71010 RepID=UPI0034635952